MSVDITKFLIATPLPVSDTNPVALELMGDLALIQCPEVISLLEGGAVRFTAPTQGASSKSTKRTRCEWKEPEYWALASAARHWSRQEITLEKVNSAQKVVIGQIHVKDATTPPLKVFWNKGKITIGFRRSFASPDIVNTVIHNSVPLGATFKLSIGVTSNGSVSINVLCNGVPSIKLSWKLDDTWQDQVLQFHGGLYNQIDYADDTPAEDGSVTVISELTVTHGAV
jgi:hypothetical protein